MALTKNKPSKQADPISDRKMIASAMAEKQKPAIKKLSAHVEKIWQRNKSDMRTVRKAMLDDLRRVRGEYGSDKASAIKAMMGSDIYLRSGENKARAGVSWIKDLYRGGEDLPWLLKPTEIPALPMQTMDLILQESKDEAARLKEEIVSTGNQVDIGSITKIVQQYYDQRVSEETSNIQKIAEGRCERASKYIKDQNQEGGWDDAFKDFLWWFVRTKFGAIKGPVLVLKKKRKWAPTADGQDVEMVTVDDYATDVYAPSPFKLYPARGIKSVNDGDMVELHELTKKALSEMIGEDGYNDDAIRSVLSGLDANEISGKWFTEDYEHEVKSKTKQTSGQETQDKDDKEIIWAMEFYGMVSGKVLQAWEEDQDEKEFDQLDSSQQYQVNCWKIGDLIIKAVINPDSLGRKPYMISSWAKNPEWIIGEGMIEFSGPIEDAMNSVLRSAINNAAIASGPLVEIDRDRVSNKVPLYPWREIDSTSKKMKAEGPAVNYYQPQMHSQELIGLFMFLSKLLDEMTVPAYAQGASQSGVTAGTATVFTQLLAAASRSIKAVVANIDDDIIKQYIQMSYDLLMDFTDDKSIKGDANVVTMGVEGLRIKEQAAQRKVEFLQIAANPTYQEILGAKNIGSVLAQVAKSNDIDLPDKARLDGSSDLDALISQMLQSQAGIDPMQENGQVATGGGAISKAQGLLADGSKAGVNNAA